eukprot:CAMPEP_0170199206 /NCGR_PEP_ID=MMETSP0040_2-20121228/69182_1 /TAXON_ID=641309 /ORGANISM="Lotharella oceanica, Strain CCMP622" /LENGTH=122 /DNA_ID=CAMNT_0010449303 /DNA_START=569 /DNA_END=937 /DNA_ORIENTATION=-
MPLANLADRYDNSFRPDLQIMSTSSVPLSLKRPAPSRALVIIESIIDENTLTMFFESTAHVMWEYIFRLFPLFFCSSKDKKYLWMNSKTSSGSSLPSYFSNILQSLKLEATEPLEATDASVR